MASDDLRARLESALATHSVECTGLGEATCRCREGGWMPWTVMRKHQADAVLAVVQPEIDQHREDIADYEALVALREAERDEARAALARVWDEGFKAGDAYQRRLWQWSAGHISRAFNGLHERPERPVNPHAALRTPDGGSDAD